MKEMIKDLIKEYEEKFDLREQNLITPVKNQNPWGTCWALPCPR